MQFGCQECIYSWLPLSRTRLSRITAYLEVKIWSLPKHENLTTGKKYCGKEEKLLLRSNFSSFPQYFQYIPNFKSPITYIFVKCGCSNYFSSILQIWYVEVRISRSISESSLEFEITRVDCISKALSHRSFIFMQAPNQWCAYLYSLASLVIYAGSVSVTHIFVQPCLGSTLPLCNLAFMQAPYQLCIMFYSFTSWVIYADSALMMHIYSRTSNSLISNYRLSRSENLVPVLTWNCDNR